MDITEFKPADMARVTAEQLEPPTRALDADMTERQREFAESVFIGLLHGAAAPYCAATVLADAAMQVTFQVEHDLGGGVIYLPKLDTLRRLKRERAIRQQFKGNNVAQLARQHGLSEMRVRQILASPQT